jgi:hypothetical protein
MGAKIFSFESELPEVLYLDSSFIINLVLVAQNILRSVQHFRKN